MILFKYLYLPVLFLGVTLSVYAQELIENETRAETVQEQDLRDPFWPVGYLPPSKRDTEAPPKLVEEASPFNFDALTPEEQAIIRKNLKVTGLLKQGDSYFAFVNNEVVRTGDMIPLRVGSQTYRFKVRSITKDTINLEPIRDNQPEKEIKPSLGE